MKLGENMYLIILNKHAEIHGDWTIGGAIKVKRLQKHRISVVNDLKLQ